VAQGANALDKRSHKHCIDHMQSVDTSVHRHGYIHSRAQLEHIAKTLHSSHCIFAGNINIVKNTCPMNLKDGGSGIGLRCEQHLDVIAQGRLQAIHGGCLQISPRRRADTPTCADCR
jgi:hypothetical protein